MYPQSPKSTMPAMRPRPVEQHVVQVQITVRDLGAQPRPVRRYTLVEPVDRSFDERAPVLVVDGVEQRAQLRCVLEIPEQLGAGGRMEEGAKRDVQPRVGRRVVVDRAIVELLAVEVTMQPFEQTDEMGAVGAVERRPFAARLRDRQLRIDPSDVQDRFVLEVERGRIRTAVRDLQDGTVAVRRRSETSGLARCRDRLRFPRARTPRRRCVPLRRP